MSYNYTGYVNALASLLVVQPTDTDFVAMLPNFIDSAEFGIYRDLDLLDTVIRDSTLNLTANSRDFTLPQSVGRFVVVNGINIITPLGATPATGTRNQVIPASRDYIDQAFQVETGASQATIPEFFAMLTSQKVIFGPAPGAAFNVEVIGTVRPIPLSASNTTTILTTFLPDLFLVASMKFGAEYLKNFGAAADDPRSAQTWNTEYQRLLQAATMEEFRKKFAASAWSSITPSPIAQPPRN